MVLSIPPIPGVPVSSEQAAVQQEGAQLLTPITAQVAQATQQLQALIAKLPGR